MKCDATRDISENCMAVLVDGEKKVASWSKTKAGDVLPVGEWKSMRFIAVRRK